MNPHLIKLQLLEWGMYILNFDIYDENPLNHEQFDKLKSAGVQLYCENYEDYIIKRNEVIKAFKPLIDENKKGTSRLRESIGL